MDYVKEDSCNAPQDHESAYKQYALMRDGLLATKRPIFFSVRDLFWLVVAVPMFAEPRSSQHAHATATPTLLLAAVRLEPLVRPCWSLLRQLSSHRAR